MPWPHHQRWVGELAPADVLLPRGGEQQTAASWSASIAVEKSESARSGAAAATDAPGVASEGPNSLTSSTWSTGPSSKSTESCLAIDVRVKELYERALCSTGGPPSSADGGAADGAAATASRPPAGKPGMLLPQLSLLLLAVLPRQDWCSHVEGPPGTT